TPPAGNRASTPAPSPRPPGCAATSAATWPGSPTTPCTPSSCAARSCSPTPWPTPPPVSPAARSCGASTCSAPTCSGWRSPTAAGPTGGRPSRTTGPPRTGQEPRGSAASSCSPPAPPRGATSRCSRTPPSTSACASGPTSASTPTAFPAAWAPTSSRPDHRPYAAPSRAAGSRTQRDEHTTAPDLHRAHLHTPRPARPRRPHRPQGTPLQPPAPLRPAPPGLRARPPGGAACHHPDPAMAGPAAHRTHPRPPRHRHRAARPPLPRRPRPHRRLPHADPPPVRPAPVDLPPFRRLRDRPLQLHRPGPALRRLPHRPTRLSRSPRSAGGGAAVRAARGRAPLPRGVVLEGGDHGRDQAPGLVEGCLGERRGADHRAHQADPDQQRAHEFGAEPGVVGAEALGEVGEVVGAELIAQPGADLGAAGGAEHDQQRVLALRPAVVGEDHPAEQLVGEPGQAAPRVAAQALGYLDVHRLGEQLPLGAEVAEDQRRVDAGVGGDVADPGAVVAVLGEAPARRLQQRGPGGRLVPASGLSHEVSISHHSLT